ncbi:MAG: phytanoyl-CoA dioxygenase family protein [Epsilonproteobacteria bacterium]|nr:MAG: phytanoyl-CoA dioxygenase family protein [Campylobacterota bacterium]
MGLSQKDQVLFKANGYLILRSFASDIICDAILEKAKIHLLARQQPIETELGYAQSSKTYRKDALDYNSQIENSENTIRRLRQVYSRDSVFQSWMEDKKIRVILQELLNDQVVISLAHHNSIMTKIPYSSTETSWHQDRRYWHYSDDNLISVWLALGDENDENGVLEFIPGSHLQVFNSEQFDAKEYFSQNNDKNIEILSKKVSYPLKKGDVVLFHSLLLHRANKNMSNAPKISFVYTVKGSKTKTIQGTRSSEFPEIILKYI